MSEKTRLQEVAWEYIILDEALRKAMLREEAANATIKRLKRLMRPAQPKRIVVEGKHGKEIWSLPL